MAVYTQLTTNQVNTAIADFDLGKTVYLNGIRDGIENSNYYLTTEKACPKCQSNNFVLTVFERTKAENLVFFGKWLIFLYSKKLPVPLPVSDINHKMVFEIAGKPAMILSKLIGVKVLSPISHHCGNIGKLLANMHNTSQMWQPKTPPPPNPRNVNWWKVAIQELHPHINDDDKKLISKTEKIIFPIWQSANVLSLAKGAIHADLFRDNVFFDEQQNHISGVFDFFFGGEDYYLYDLAVTINEWCSYRSSTLQIQSYNTLLTEYQKTRPLTDNEKQLLPLMLLSAAFRFYLSRLHDVYFPRDGMVDAHEPKRFRDLVINRLSTLNGEN